MLTAPILLGALSLRAIRPLTKATVDTAQRPSHRIFAVAKNGELSEVTRKGNAGIRGCSSHHTKERRNYHEEKNQIGFNENCSKELVLFRCWTEPAKMSATLFPIRNTSGFTKTTVDTAYHGARLYPSSTARNFTEISLRREGGNLTGPVTTSRKTIVNDTLTDLPRLKHLNKL